jgi:AcrR family transcriptional regulator
MFVESRKDDVALDVRPTQAARRARTRHALLESAARGISRHGYGNLALERVASDAGYSRGALYHLFADKEDLALAVVAWVEETWQREVGRLAEDESDPLAALIRLARGHAVYCRRDVARVLVVLRVEFSDHEHPVALAVQRILDTLAKRFIRLIIAGRKAASIPPGPPARTLAHALTGAIEGTVIQLAGQSSYDQQLAERVLLGVLGLSQST